MEHPWHLHGKLSSFLLRCRSRYFTAKSWFTLTSTQRKRREKKERQEKNENQISRLTSALPSPSFQKRPLLPDRRLGPRILLVKPQRDDLEPRQPHAQRHGHGAGFFARRAAIPRRQPGHVGSALPRRVAHGRSASFSLFLLSAVMNHREDDTLNREVLANVRYLGNRRHVRIPRRETRRSGHACQRHGPGCAYIKSEFLHKWRTSRVTTHTSVGER